MKKLITLFLVLTLTCSLVACSSGGDTNMTGVLDNELSVMGGEHLYGKITNVVGNEIELALAEIPEYDAPSDDEGEGENEAIDIPDDGGVAAAVAQPIAPVDNQNIEYTGETISITIPSGVNIYSMGQETTVSALKKGSMVTIIVDNLEDMNVQLVDIMG